MEKKFVMMLSLLILAVCCIGLSFPAYGMSSSDHIPNVYTSVEEFAKDPTIDLKMNRNEYTPHAVYIVLSSANEEFWVNEESLVVERYSSFDDLLSCDRVILSKEEAILKAKIFLRDHGCDSNLESFTLVKDELNNGGDILTYDILWQEFIGEILTPNFTFISVNPNTGSIVDYIDIKRPITVLLNPAISKEEALNIAVKQFKGIEIEESSISPRIWYYGENLQKLVWDCTITGKPKDYVLQGGNVIIDAVTGEVISRSRWL